MTYLYYSLQNKSLQGYRHVWCSYCRSQRRPNFSELQVLPVWTAFQSVIPTRRSESYQYPGTHYKNNLLSCYIVISSETSLSLMNTCCFDLWMYVIHSKDRLTDMSFNHWEPLDPQILFHFKVIHLLAINKQISINVISAFIRLYVIWGYL